ncbi:hypothetical protein MMC14_010369 [Varicellaria rhodocarpa]|nr:hypothetical protein [Varicellaria rhodocarpa]
MAPNLAWEPLVQNLSRHETNLTRYTIDHSSIKQNNNNNTSCNAESPTTKVFIPILVIGAMTLVIGAIVLRFLASTRLSKARQTEQRAHTHQLMTAAHQAYVLEVFPIRESTETRPFTKLPPPVYRALPARGK